MQVHRSRIQRKPSTSQLFSHHWAALLPALWKSAFIRSASPLCWPLRALTSASLLRANRATASRPCLSLTASDSFSMIGCTHCAVSEARKCPWGEINGSFGNGRPTLYLGATFPLTPSAFVINFIRCNLIQHLREWRYIV